MTRTAATPRNRAASDSWISAKRDRDAVDPADYATEMRRLAEGYGGFWPEIRSTITDPEQVNYTWFDRLLAGPGSAGAAAAAVRPGGPGSAAACCATR